MTPEQMERIYVSESTRLVRVAYLMCGDHAEAEDVVAEAFAQCWRRWQTNPPDTPGGYLHRVVVNTAVRRMNRRRRTIPVDRAATVGAPDDRLTLLAALDTLAIDQRAVIVLRYFDDLSEHDVAELLDLRPGTVKSRAARGLRRLEASLRSTYEVTE
jgi:RNA polymerase sigma-70 factor (sigma-E family)